MTRRESKVRLQRGIIILPSAFTLGNLYFGISSMVAISRGDPLWASWFIVFAAALDLLDGRIARFTRTGSAFGAELDSLVDAVSFGVAPGFLMIQLYFSDGWGWVLGFVYITAVVVRLARFNVEQAGEARRHFHGLPSPTAGMILATYYPFSQTRLFDAWLSTLPWPQILPAMLVLLSVLMLSHVPYAKVPRLDLTTRRGVLTTALLAAGTVTAAVIPEYWFFPALVVYTSWALVKTVVLGLLERLPDRDPLLDADDEGLDDGIEPRELDYDDLTARRARQSGTRPGPWQDIS